VATLANSIVSQIRAYEMAIRNWLLGFPSDDKGDIYVVTSTPDRAFASMRELLHLKGNASKDIPVRSIPLPFISMYMVGSNFDPSRNRGQGNVNLATSEGRIYRMKHPIPYTFDYRIEFWAKNQNTLNVLKEHAALSFNYGFEKFLSVDLSSAGFYSDFRVPILNNGIVFSGVEEPEKDHRVLREVLNIQLKGWLLNPIGTVAQIHKIIVDYCDDSSGSEVLLDSQVITDTE
jgi:hypothetical protein